ncbi:MAG TPA: nucleotidyl transferase AbiEii/AbiGii toxin family protein [Bacteroidota bacterium]|nr:nucleotidyl transferase AbiEii/AbiGii toxin family protein [Bacteroidota bacterium]
MKLDAAVANVAKVLRAAQIPYIIMGGQAVLQYGSPRLTKDVDVTVGVGIEEFERVRKAFEGSKFVPVSSNPGKFVRETYVFILEDPKTAVRVDVIFTDLEFEREAIRRAKTIKVDNTPVAFASIEDLIVQKIVAGRPRDLEDVAGILAHKYKLDRDYIEGWLKDFESLLNKRFVPEFKKLCKKFY